ncbi:hypothetical protein HYS54_02105 [Candidatus Micrarchaeota archaeon]|nr:hypothetical protein [Candidatus Micrarchaeota archaeon]
MAVGFDKVRGYSYSEGEANFGPALAKAVKGGAHISYEILLKHSGRYIALRRLNGIPGHQPIQPTKRFPKGFLFFCHDPPRYGETVEESLKRIVKAQAGVNVVNWRNFYIETLNYEDQGQWAIIPHFIADIDAMPKPNKEITEVVAFEKETVPGGFAWWKRKELAKLLK